MKQSQLWLRALARLRIEREKQGETKSSLSKRMDHGENYLSRNLDPETPRWNVLFAALEALDLPPERFFEIVGESRPHYLLEKFSPAGEAHVLHRRFLKRLDELDVLLPLEGVAERRPMNLAVKERLERLEDQRHGEPETVGEACYELVKKVLDDGRLLSTNDAIQVVGALAIWGSVQRHQGDLEAARVALVKSLYCAQELNVPWLVARTIQRAAMVLKSFEEYDVGLMLLRMAGDLYLGCQDLVGFGKVLVDRALLHYYQNSLEIAEALARCSLDERLIPKRLWRYRASALWICGRTRLLDEDFQQALEAFQESASITQSEEPRLSACHRKAAGDILVRLGSFEEAVELYEEAAALYLQVNELSASLEASLGIAVAHWRSERKAELPELAQQLDETLRPLVEKIPAFGSELAEAIHLLTEPTLELQEIEIFRRKLEGQTEVSA